MYVADDYLKGQKTLLHKKSAASTTTTTVKATIPILLSIMKM